MKTHETADVDVTGNADSAFEMSTAAVQPIPAHVPDIEHSNSSVHARNLDGKSPFMTAAEGLDSPNHHAAKAGGLHDEDPVHFLGPIRAQMTGDMHGVTQETTATHPFMTRPSIGQAASTESDHGLVTSSTASDVNVGGKAEYLGGQPRHLSGGRVPAREGTTGCQAIAQDRLEHGFTGPGEPQKQSWISGGSTEQAARDQHDSGVEFDAVDGTSLRPVELQQASVVCVAAEGLKHGLNTPEPTCSSAGAIENMNIWCCKNTRVLMLRPRPAPLDRDGVTPLQPLSVTDVVRCR